MKQVMIDSFWSWSTQLAYLIVPLIVIWVTFKIIISLFFTSD